MAPQPPRGGDAAKTYRSISPACQDGVELLDVTLESSASPGAPAEKSISLAIAHQRIRES